MNRASADVNLRYAFRAFRRRLPIFLLCVLIVPALAVGISLVQKKEYTATASLFFRDPHFDQMVFGSSVAQPQPDPTVQSADNLDLVSLHRVAALTAANLRGISEDQVLSAVSLSSKAQSDLVSIQATSRSPSFAAKLANTYATQYIAFRRDADRATINSAEQPLRRQIASLPAHLRNGSLGQSLQTRLSQLRVLASLQTGNAELVQPAEVPRAQSSPKPVRNAALGLFFGILLGIGLIILAETLDRRLRDTAEAEQIFERPIFAALPQSNSLERADAALLAVPEDEREAFRMLWANVRYFTLSREIRSVLITSADRDDGKSTVAWGLGAAAAGAGNRTLVVEADLRNPTFAQRFDLSTPYRRLEDGRHVRNGLSSVLTGDVPLSEAVLRYPFPRREGDTRPTRSMDILFAGPSPPDPSDLLQSQRMADFLRAATDQYDLVVIDTPPAAVVSDAIPLITMVDGLIVVCRLGNTLRDHARRLRHELDNLDAPTLGVVVNSADEAQPYGYPYGAGYEIQAPAAEGRRNGARPKAGDRGARVSASSSRVGGRRSREGQPN